MSETSHQIEWMKLEEKKKKKDIKIEMNYFNILNFILY